jgi:hypothetical protein
VQAVAEAGFKTHLTPHLSSELDGQVAQASNANDCHLHARVGHQPAVQIISNQMFGSRIKNTFKQKQTPKREDPSG